MKSAINLLILFILSASFVSAALNLEIEKIDKGSVIISELNNPAVFDLIINNKGSSDNVEIYSLVGMSMFPKGTFDLPAGKTTIEIKANPDIEIRKREGAYSLEFQIKGNQGIFKDKLPIRVVSLENVFTITAKNIHPDDSSAVIYIRNNVNANIENVKIRFKSVFFDSTKEISIGPNEEANITIPINKEKTKKLTAGPYIMNAEIEVEGEEVSLESLINYLEKEGISVNRSITGFIIRESKITKTNEGSVSALAKIEIQKDIISRLFTSFSLSPPFAERTGLVVQYAWEKQIAPGETFIVQSKTNYTLPFLTLILIIAIALITKLYLLTPLTVNKKVYLVRTKGGEFALRVKVNVKARKKVSNVKVSDRLPGSTELLLNHSTKPDKIDEKSRMLHWHIAHLNAGEDRTFSYVVYSKIRVVGNFELPSALVSFEHNNKPEQVSSNKAFFMSETTAPE